MKIPKTFQLAGITWKVVESDSIIEMGHYTPETATIWLRASLPRQAKEATFCHELQHAIRYAAGQQDHDEREVDAHGNFLHQFLTTWK
jgi:uncharacterized protein YjaZ